MIDNVDNSYLGVTTVGTDEDIPDLIKDGWTDAFITVGSVGNTNVRRYLYEMVKGMGLHIPTIIDSSAIVGKGISIGYGTFIGKRAIINTGSSIGKCAIINTGAIIEHDCKIGDFSHISPGTTLCGQVTIGNNSHIGANSTIRQLIKIGDNSLIGAGSVVVKDIISNKKAYGNPCKVVD